MGSTERKRVRHRISPFLRSRVCSSLRRKCSSCGLPDTSFFFRTHILFKGIFQTIYICRI
uniref:Uncharacterized protein n=1 Tax=Lepeophtheirus salmonis TaxID=72036 RepID=A0A0K2THN4_LEPSM